MTEIIIKLDINENKVDYHIKSSEPMSKHQIWQYLDVIRESHKIIEEEK